MNYGELMAYNLADYYEKKLGDVRLEYDGKFFSQFTELELKTIYIKCISTFRFYPTIAELTELLQPKEDSKDQANEMTGSILQAVRDYGRHQALKVKMLLGPIAWFAIESFGGWDVICNVPEDQLATSRAQLRDMCKSALTIKSRVAIKDNLLEYQKHGMRKLGFCQATNYIENKGE